MTYPHVRVAGSPRHRGRRYGEQAADRVVRSIAVYKESFAVRWGLEWSTARRIGQQYLDSVEAFAPAAVEEMSGIAEGAGVDFVDVLALNCRTEIGAYGAAAADGRFGRTDGCTSLTLRGATVLSDSEPAPIVVAQNWDWLAATRDTVVVVEADCDDRPAYVTFVEAGLLAKAGFNAAGLAVATNFLLSTDDVRGVGVPYHVLLSVLLSCRNLAQAYLALQRLPRVSSANFMLAHRDGGAVDIEAAPGGFETLYLTFPDAGVLTHTNHFCAVEQFADPSLLAVPDSPFRLDRVDRAMRGRSRWTLSEIQALLADHADYPTSVCTHSDPSVQPAAQEATVLSVVMDPRGVAWLADGNPCTTRYRELDYRGFFGGDADGRGAENVA